MTRRTADDRRSVTGREPWPAPGAPADEPGPTARSVPPPWTIVGLALLGVPRVVLHDLDTVSSSSVVYLVLAIAPLIAWVAYLVVTRPARPVVSGLWIGGVFGVLLGAVHQVLWTEAYDEPPRLGGNLEGELDPWLEDLVLRVFAAGSSLVTGLVLGVLAGVVASVIARSRPD